jgi:hypothetical protein
MGLYPYLMLGWGCENGRSKIKAESISAENAMELL